MIIVHDTFICKPGQASKMAKMFKTMMGGEKSLVNIMTDLTGDYNKVVMVSQYESLTAYEKSWEKYEQEAKKGKDEKKDAKKDAEMENYHNMFLTGHRDIYRVWDK